VALLCALLAIGAGPLVVAHLNHRLRGPDSDADEEFVRGLCASLTTIGTVSVEFCRHQIDVKTQAGRDNLENAARRLRYEWLAEVARRRQVRWVATGHTADDQAETVVHRLLRGTGLKGLRGIAPRRSLGAGVEVVRPLLQVTRADVLAFLKDRGQAYREDRSNADRRFTRNRIRHDLLPRLAEQYNPAIVSVLGRLAEQADEVYRDVEERARQLLGEAELPRAGSCLVFDRQRLAAGPRYLVRDMFRLLWQRERWPMGRMTFAEWDRVAAVARGEVVAIDLPGRIHVQCQERVIQMVRSGDAHGSGADTQGAAQC
jgi:tRNA(Ile)-lysidine synthase